MQKNNLFTVTDIPELENGPHKSVRTVYTTEYEDSNIRESDVDLILKLDILTIRYTSREYESYKKKLVLYEEVLEEWRMDEDRLGMSKSPKPKAPIEPKPLYTPVFVNFSNRLFKGCVLETDADTGEECVLAEFFDLDLNMMDTFSIRISHDEWITYLEKYFKYKNVQ